MTDERSEASEQSREPLVTLCGPVDHPDVVDLASGLRFLQGKATGVPLSVAEEIASRRRGFFIEVPPQFVRRTSQGKLAGRET
jgi:hypothetical protein